MNNKLCFEYQLSLLETPEESYLKKLDENVKIAVDNILCLPVAIFKQKNQRILINKLLTEKSYLLSCLVREFYNALVEDDKLGDGIESIVNEQVSLTDLLRARELEREIYEGVDNSIMFKMMKDIEGYVNTLSRMEVRIFKLQKKMNIIRSYICGILNIINDRFFTAEEEIDIEAFVSNMKYLYLIPMTHDDDYDGEKNKYNYIDFYSKGTLKHKK